MSDDNKLGEVGIWPPDISHLYNPEKEKLNVVFYGPNDEIPKFEYVPPEPLKEGELLVHWLGENAHLGEEYRIAMPINNCMCIPIEPNTGGCIMITKEQAIEFFNLVEKDES